MRKGLLGSIAALAAGAGVAWGQQPAGPGGAPACAPVVAPEAPLPPIGGPPTFGGFPSHAIPGNAGFAPAPVILPPGNYGPPNDPLGLGPVGGFGPPPGPMYPVPGPYAAQSFQPSPPMPDVGGMGGGSGSGGGLGYGSAPRWWVEGEYLLWFNSKQPIPTPILSTSAPADAGLLGAASTTVLVGTREVDFGLVNGFRLSAGFFGDADRRFGFNLTGFSTEQKANFQRFGGAQNSIGIPLLARPFIDTVTGAPSSVVLSGPDFGPSGAVFSTRSQTYSIEPSAVWNLYRSGPGSRLVWSMDFLAGYRYLELKEQLGLDTRTTFNGQLFPPVFSVGQFGVITQLNSTTPIPAQTTFGGVNVVGPSAVIDTRDNIRVRNKFNMASFALRTEARYGMVTANWFTKIGVGTLNERMEVFGGGALSDPSGQSGSQFGANPGGIPLGGPVPGRTNGTAYGGLLFTNGQIGTFDQNRFTFVPEVGGNIGIALTRGLTGFIGWNVLYMPDVIRPGNQINPFLNSAAVPFSPNYGAAAARTGFVRFVESDYWIGGLNLGLTLKY
ncbi:MAG: BBP7 family outer membrane beta-barrel protein [Gemmata sp.]